MPEPRPLRENDTLGRAGRVSAKGNRIEVQRNRSMTAFDARHATVEVAGVEHPHLVVRDAPDDSDILLAEDDDDHRSLQYLDGKSEPRPPKTWENMEAERRREIAASEREAFARSLKRERAAMNLPERIAKLQHRALTMQSMRAVQVRETDARSATAQDRAPQGEGHDAIGYASSDQVAADWRQIELLVEKIEGYWDAHDGIVVKDVQLMGSDEKNALLLGPKLRGLHPDVIHAIYGDAIGSPRTIRYVRNQAGQTNLGHPKPERTERAA